MQFSLIRENHHALKKRNSIERSNHKQVLEVKPNIQKNPGPYLYATSQWAEKLVTDWPGPRTH